MESVNVKKMAAAFMLLAVATGSLAFVFSLPKNEPPTASKQQGRESVSVPGNAFVQELPPQNPKPITAGEVFPEDALKTDNLTDRLTLALGKRISARNPDGPSRDEAGLPGLTAPDINAVVQDMIDTQVAKGLPLWEEGIANERINVVLDNSAQTIIDYQKGLNKILEPGLGDIGTLLTSEQNIELPAAAKSIDLTIRQMRELPVPEQSAGMHWAILRSLIYAKKQMEAGATADNDPLRTLLVLRYNDQAFKNSLQNIIEESQKKTSVRPFLSYAAGQNGLAALLGIREAQAIVLPTVDIPAILLKIGQIVVKIATEKLKDSLVHRLVAQTIRWIQGGGKPQFVTDWKGFVTDTVKNATDQALSEVYPELCNSFGPLIRVAVLPVNPEQETPPACTINQVIANVNAFAHSFESGGWIAYGATLQPSNNFWGSLIQTNEFLRDKAAREQQAAENDADSSGGGISQKQCVLYDEKRCDKALELNAQGKLPDAQVDAECDVCLEYKNTTPGGVVLDTLSDSFKAPLLRIVNAQDMVALFNALINAALSKLTNMAQSSVSKGVLGLKPFSDSGNACDGMTGDDLKNCMGTFSAPKCEPTYINLGLFKIKAGAKCTGGGVTSPVGNIDVNATTTEDFLEDNSSSCAAENCGEGCFCDVHDGLKPSDFCFLGAVQGAVQAAIDETTDDACNPSTGLAKAGANYSCSSNICVCNGEAFGNYVIARVKTEPGVTDARTVGEEIGVLGTCGTPLCSRGGPADCPRPNEPGTCMDANQRDERYKLVTSGGFIQGRTGDPKAICPAQ